MTRSRGGVVPAWTLSGSAPAAVTGDPAGGGCRAPQPTTSSASPLRRTRCRLPPGSGGTAATTGEAQRAEFALDLALRTRPPGRRRPPSSGEPGVFAMASVVLDPAADAAVRLVPVRSCRDHELRRMPSPAWPGAPLHDTDAVAVDRPQAVGRHPPGGSRSSGMATSRSHLQHPLAVERRSCSARDLLPPRDADTPVVVCPLLRQPTSSKSP